MAKLPAATGSTASRYEILCKLAVGGMAEIFLARATSVSDTGGYCVLKRILRDRVRDAEFVQMFLDEARLAAQLQHPNIASVYDIGVLGESYFFTMEYVHGETVRSLLQRAQGVRRAVPIGCVLTIVAGAAAGLHHAHERRSKDGRPLGIVHRDVSPSNLMVSYQGGVKIVDFGVAKAADRGVETRAGTVKGKISYMSPEQCCGAEVDRRSDLFSLGIVMWEMLTGTRLYRRASALENMVAIVSDDALPPSALRSEVPRVVDDLVQRLLAKSVDDRFQTAAEVVEAIAEASSQVGATLSALPVSRLVRELFGTRPEPWLELEPGARSGDRPSQELTQIARSLEFSETDGISAELEAMLEAMASYTPSAARSLSAPASVVTTLGWMPPAVSATAPSVVYAASSSGAIRPAVLGLADRPESPFGASAPPSALHAYGSAASAGIVGVGLRRGSVPIAAPAHPIATAGPNATPPHGATVAMAIPFGAAVLAPNVDSDPGPVPGERPPWDSSSSPAAATPSAAFVSRIPWRLVVVIVTGVAIGVGAAWLSARDVQRESVPRELPVEAPARPEAAVVVPSTTTPPPVASAPATGAAADAPREDPPEIDFSEPMDDPSASQSRDVAPSLGPALEGAPVPSDPDLAPAPEPKQDPPAVRPSFKKLAALYAAHDYPSVAASCRDVDTRVSIAWVCFMAACRQKDVAEAKRWLLVSRPGRRDKLAAACQQVGEIDLRSATHDCAADRLDCRGPGTTEKTTPVR